MNFLLPHNYSVKLVHLLAIVVQKTSAIMLCVRKTKIVFLFSLLKIISCFEQICNFEETTQQLPETPELKYYLCGISNTSLAGYESEEITTMTNHSESSKKDSDVQMVCYEDENIVTFIPNSLFIQFSNLEYFCINKNQDFEVMTPEYLKNATNLKYFVVTGNLITKLNENIFIEAPKIEQINLMQNEITAVHFLAFNGLNNLKVLNLQGNKITHLDPLTFSSLISKPKINLLNNTCIHKNFTQSNSSSSYIQEIESEIYKSYCIHKTNITNLTSQIDELKDLFNNLTTEHSNDAKTISDVKSQIHDLTTIIKELEKGQKISDMNRTQEEFRNILDGLTNQTKNVNDTTKILSEVIERLKERLKDQETKHETERNYLMVGLIAVATIFTIVGLIHTICIIKQRSQPKKLTQQDTINQQLQEKFKLKKLSKHETDSIELSMMMDNF